MCVCADLNGLTAGEILFSPELRRETEGTDADKTVRHSGKGCGQPVRTLPESLSGDSEQGKEEREGTAGGAQTGIGAAGKCLNGWDVQSKHIQPADGIAEALYAGECRYAGGESYVMPSAISFQERAGKPGGGKGILIQNEHTGALSTLNNQSVFCLQGNGIDRADTAGCNGKGWKEDVSYTLNTIDRPAVVALNDQGGSVMNVSTEATGALRAQEHGHQPIVYNGGERNISTKQVKSHAGDPCHSLTTDSRNYLVEASKSEPGKNPVRCYDMDNERRRGPDEFIDLSPALTARCGTGGNNVPVVADAGNASEPIMIEMTSTKNTIIEDGISTTLTARMGTGGNQVMRGAAETLLARDYKDPQCVAAVDCRNGTENAEINGTLQAKEQGQNLNSNNVVRIENVPRRLSPLECERLQMMPDGWTDIGEWVDEKGKKRKPSDSPRYKALGNSIALPFWFWLLRRISAQYERPATLGSMFSGISGFDLCWTRCNGIGSVLWESEVEGFCIAVSTQHFGDEDRGIEGDVQKYL